MFFQVNVNQTKSCKLKITFTVNKIGLETTTGTTILFYIFDQSFVYRQKITYFPLQNFEFRSSNSFIYYS